MDEIREWFNKLLAVRQQYCFQPSDIWNMDETGFRIGVARDQKVLSLNKQTPAYIAAGNNRETVTIIEAISADGATTPAMAIVAGKEHQETWFDELKDTTAVAVSFSGYSNDYLAYQWLQHFDKYSSNLRKGSHRLLILDGHESHCTKEFLDYCHEHLIIVLALPPHTTHLLQPLDVGVFQPYKHWHAKAVDEALQTGCVNYTKAEFLADFEGFRDKALTPRTIISAFYKTGIEPFDPEMVLMKLRQLRPITPPEQAIPQEISTPHTIKSFLRVSRQFIERLEADAEA